MLLENFPLSEVQQYRIAQAISLNPIKEKKSKRKTKTFNLGAYNIVKKILLMVIVAVLPISNGFGFAEIISLKAVSGIYSDETVIRLKEETTTDFDPNWDAYKLSNAGNTPNLYSSLNGTNYAINSFSGDFIKFTLPLNFKPAFSGSYSLVVKSLKASSNSSYTITLEDKLLNTTEILSEGFTYKFEASIVDMTDRFVLHYTKSAPSISLVSGIKTEIDNNQISFTVTSEGATINFNDPHTALASVSVISSEGKVIYSQENVSTFSGTTISLNNNQTGSIYIIRVVMEDKMFCKKLSF